MPGPRHEAVKTALSRDIRTFQRPTGADGRPQRISAFFGSRCFGADRMRERLPPDIFRRWQDVVEKGVRPERPVADAIAHAVKEWAIEQGATHFCHWFHPMTGLTAEKHDSFLAFDSAGRAIEKFTGAMLIQSEPDASSFPSGGMRSTFEARGYTNWDPTSPMFLMDTPNGRTLCIPSAFLGYHGQALDEKAPLLRSMDAINRSAGRLLSLLSPTGEHPGRITVTVGPEQEYFVIDRAYAALRPDLVIAGRSVLGARAPKGQSLEDHYFGSIPQRVQSFMEEVEVELYYLGVSAKTRHNEVAPSQFELAPIFCEANLAADHNQLVMSTLRKVAARHDLIALLHEKPFAGVNGSGKHLNWSMSDNKGHNLLDPGDNPSENLRFLAVLASILLGVHRHAAVLRASIASYANDYRLGANEAPPAIISVFLGDALTRVVEAAERGENVVLDPGAPIQLAAQLPLIARDNTDRNRTSPFAFTGNKFEFRAVGASASISWPGTCLNAVVADGMDQLAAWIEADASPDRVLSAVRRALTEAAPVRFDGNGYSAEWVQEAEGRGLPHARTTPAALSALRQQAATDLFTRQKVLSPEELRARHDVRLDQYNKRVEIEIDLLLRLVDTQILPAVERDAQEFSGGWRGRQLEAGLEAIIAARVELNRLLSNHVEGEEARAEWLCHTLLPAAQNLRAACDRMEEICSDERWPLPSYYEMLFLS